MLVEATDCVLVSLMNANVFECRRNHHWNKRTHHLYNARVNDDVDYPLKEQITQGVRVGVAAALISACCTTGIRSGAGGISPRMEE